MPSGTWIPRGDDPTCGLDLTPKATELYPPGEWSEVASRIDRFACWLRLEQVAGQGRVYSLRPLKPQ